MKRTIRNLVLSAMFLALGLVLPFLTGQIQHFGQMLLPMHIPVFLCALICGWEFGVPVALILPLMRSFLFGMPPLFPTAAAMSVELCTYALTAGLMYKLLKPKGIISLYISMIAAMIAGRIVWGGAMAILLGVSGGAFTMQAFLNGAVLTAWPGIIVQLILIPAVMFALDRAGLIRFRADEKTADAAE